MRIISTQVAATLAAGVCGFILPAANAQAAGHAHMVIGAGRSSGHPQIMGSNYRAVGYSHRSDPSRLWAQFPVHPSYTPGYGGSRFAGTAGYRRHGGLGRYRASYSTGGDSHTWYGGAGYTTGAGYGTNAGYGAGAGYAALSYASAPAYSATPVYFSGPAYAEPQSYVLPATVYREVTRSYTVPVHSYQTVVQTHYAPMTTYRPITVYRPVTTYQPVETAVRVPVTTYQTYQQTQQIPTTVYRRVQPACDCAYNEAQ